MKIRNFYQIQNLLADIQKRSIYNRIKTKSQDEAVINKSKKKLKKKKTV